MLLVANWKMNLSLAEAKNLVENSMKFLDSSIIDAEVVIAPSYTMLTYVRDVINKHKHFHLSAQDCSFAEKGAYTGDVSSAMLKDVGCDYVILGHSERKIHHLETCEITARKVKMACAHGLDPIICIGESADERKNGETFGVLEDQLHRIVPSDYNKPTIIIAYEPIWAIGSGVTPTIEEIKEVVDHIHAEVHVRFPHIKDIQILYGGSVNPGNCGEVLKIKGIDGLLIGGASLIYEEFIKIMKSVKI